MPTALTFLHASPVHIAPFDELVRCAAPGAQTHHAVDEALLVDPRWLSAVDVRLLLVEQA